MIVRPMKPRVAAIVPAAGSGKRLSSGRKKPYVLLRGRPLITYALDALDSSPHINSIIVAVDGISHSLIKDIIKRRGYKKIKNIVTGGQTRAQSVKNCFDAIALPCDIVLIHDAARPFLKEPLIRNAVRLAKKYGACLTAVPATDTIKAAGSGLFSVRTLDRSRLWMAQTPQAFKYAILKNALRIKKMPGFTDESAMVERAGRKVKIAEGSAENIKITTRADLKLAEAMLRYAAVNTDDHRSKLICDYL